MKMKGPTKNQTSSPHWMAALARFNNEFMEDEKYHNLVTWLIYLIISGSNEVEGVKADLLR